MTTCTTQVERSRWLRHAGIGLVLLATVVLAATVATTNEGLADPPAAAHMAAQLQPALPASVPGNAGSAGAVSGSGVAGNAAASAPLPSHFTVELGYSGTLYADGRELANPAELERVAREAAARGTFAGAVLFGDPRSGSTLEAVADVLRRAGFATLVEARRSAPPEVSALAVAERERARRARERLIAAGVIEGDDPAPRATSPARSSRVELQTVGLHLAAPANTEPVRRKLVKLFERNFDAFRRCHGSAPPHTDGASFGVDLLIPKEGGRAKVRESRTRLTSPAFKACMEKAFEAIRFDPPVTARPEIVSYSVLFKPPR